MSSILITSKTNMSKNRTYDSQILTASCRKLKLNFFMTSSVKLVFDFSDYSVELKHYDDSNALVVVKTKYEMSGAPIEEFVKLEAKNVLKSSKRFQ